MIPVGEYSRRCLTILLTALVVAVDSQYCGTTGYYGGPCGGYRNCAGTMQCQQNALQVWSCGCVGNRPPVLNCVDCQVPYDYAGAKCDDGSSYCESTTGLRCVSGKCACSEGEYNSTSRNCKLRPGEICDPNGSVFCQIGYTCGSTKTCVPCGTLTSYNAVTHNCDCTGDAIPLPGTGMCACSQGEYNSTSGKCEFRPGGICDPNGSVFCQIGYTCGSTKTCVPCGTLTSYNAVTHNCDCTGDAIPLPGTGMCACSQGEYNSTSGKCEFRPGGICDPNGSVFCQIGYTCGSTKTCVPCGTLTSYNAVTHNCDCTGDAFPFSGSGMCACPSNAAQTKGSACKCQDGYALSFIFCRPISLF